MTVFHKAESRGLSKATDRSRLRDKAGALVHYIWRAHLQELARVEMMTSVDSYHSDLMRYVRRDDHTEEVAAKLVRKILCQSPEAIAEEVASLLEAIDGGDGLVEHFIISLRKDEEVLEHFEEAVEILLEGLGLENCPAVAAVHLDTENPHIHIMVARIDVDTGEPVPLPQYDLLRAHQLLARMEDRFGWRREADARWEVRDDRLIGDNGAIDLGPANEPQSWPDENFSRAKSAKAQPRLVRDSDALPGTDLIRKVIPDLVERHSEIGGFVSALAKNGIELAMTGSNASYRINYVDDDGRTASENIRPSVLRKWSTSQLIKRFDVLPDKFGSTPVTPQRVSRDQLDRIRFASEKAAFQDRLNRISSALRKALGKSASDQISLARAACEFPAFEEWLAGARPTDPAGQLAEATGAGVVCSAANDGGKPRLAVVDDPHFQGRRFGEKVIYTEKGSVQSATRVTDCGGAVVIVGPPSDAAVSLSLRLLKERGADAVVAQGFSKRDYARVCKIAASMDLEIGMIRKEQAQEKDWMPASNVSSPARAPVAVHKTGKAAKRSSWPGFPPDTGWHR